MKHGISGVARPTYQAGDILVWEVDLIEARSIASIAQDFDLGGCEIASIGCNGTKAYVDITLTRSALHLEIKLLFETAPLAF